MLNNGVFLMDIICIFGLVVKYFIIYQTPAKIPEVPDQGLSRIVVGNSDSE